MKTPVETYRRAASWLLLGVVPGWAGCAGKLDSNPGHGVDAPGVVMVAPDTSRKKFEDLSPWERDRREQEQRWFEDSARRR